MPFPSSAASCKRRSAEGEPQPTQLSTAAQLPQRRQRSAAHKLSPSERVLTTTTRARSTPQNWNPGAYGSCGGATNTSHFSDRESCDSAGISKRSSPAPDRPTSNSVSAARGQPPPGSCASSSAKPVATLSTATFAY